MSRKGAAGVELKKGLNAGKNDDSTASPSKPKTPGTKKDVPLWRTLTIEPVLVMHMTSAMIAFMAVQDLLLEKACRVNFSFGEKICTALESRDTGSYVEEESQVQKLIGEVMMYRTMLENLFPILLVCLIGAWSDKYGRKLPLLFVAGSFIIQHLGLVACSVASTPGAWTVGLVSSVIVSLAGNNACFGMSIFSYVADTTPKDKISGRTAITGSCFFLGITLGMGLGGALASSGLGFPKIFGLAALIEIIAFVYLLVFIPNVRDEKKIKGISTAAMIKDIFNLNHISDAIMSVFKKRSGNDRKKLLLLLMSHSLVMAPMFGEGAVMYLFSIYQFGWDAGTFSAFMTYKMVIGFIGNFVAMGLLTHALKMTDPAVGIIACLSQLVASVMFAFAQSATVMYMAPMVSILSGSIMSVARSQIFKIVPGSETGKVNSFIGSLESLTPLVITPAYSMIYTATFERLAGAFFLLSGAFMVPPILLYIWLLNEGKGKKD